MFVWKRIKVYFFFCCEKVGWLIFYSCTCPGDVSDQKVTHFVKLNTPNFQCLPLLHLWYGLFLLYKILCVKFYSRQRKVDLLLCKCNLIVKISKFFFLCCSTGVLDIYCCYCIYHGHFSINCHLGMLINIRWNWFPIILYLYTTNP